ncbi:MAG TPA: alpha/beta fold hydrolase [Thermoanaerobaculia bacterium]|nr:alpha/beta fold hydrolase [Thermoanaerobaculia bacterium]
MRRNDGSPGFFARWTKRLLITAAVVLATIVLVRAFDARRPPFLKPWHRYVPPSEVRAADMTENFTLEDYLRREDQVFREVKENVEDRLAPEDRTAANRYFPDSAASPRRFPRDWNRTFELAPAEIKGGALLLHGMTDSPYSMRRLGEVLRDRGFYVLGLRVPGHGTVPGALTRVQWEDWIAATRVGARHVRRRIGEGKPFFLVGYSNGGALSVLYALDVLEGAKLPKADRIVLLSPMIGVSPAAGLAKFIGLLAVFPYFEKTRWLDVLPEYNPYKYNSFPANAGKQSHGLTTEIQTRIARLAGTGRLRQLPPILAFQSVVDATVLAGAVVFKLFDALDDNGSELVLFDLNRGAQARPFLRPSADAITASYTAAHPRRYRLTVITNAGPDTPEVVERSIAAGETAARERPLGLSWPAHVYSLSHIALPFPTNDPLYGGEPDPGLGGLIHLGTVAPRGERSVLTVDPGDLLRVSWNPFFPYLERRVVEWEAP